MSPVKESAEEMLARIEAMVRMASHYRDREALGFVLETRADLLTMVRTALLANIRVDPPSAWVEQARAVIAKATGK